MFQAGYGAGAAAGRGGAASHRGSCLAWFELSADRGACQGGAGSGDGAWSTPSLYSVDCSSELGVHRPSSHWENNLTSQQWMELRDRLSGNCISCWVGNLPGTGPAPMAVMAMTRQAGLTAPGPPSSLHLEGPLSPGLVLTPNRTKQLHQDQSTSLKVRVPSLVVLGCLQWPDVVLSSFPVYLRRPFSVSFREVSYPALWSSPLRALLAKR